MEIYSSRQLLGDLASPSSAFNFFSPGLEFIRAFNSEADFLVEISLHQLESFSAGLEEDVVEFRDRRSCAQSFERIPQSDRSHINHQGEYFPIYREEGYDYRRGVVLDMVKLLRCLLPKGRPCLF